MPLVLVTGATDGIGKQTALDLARRGAHVLVHGRNEKKARAAAEELSRAAELDVFRPVHGDLSSLAEVRALAKQVPADVDVVVHNAGVYKERRELTVDGLETTFEVNHLAPFVLTHLLLPQLRTRPLARGGARIVVVASMVHSGGHLDFDDLQLSRRYDGYSAYANSKLANVLFAFDLARRLKSTRITVNALHPGVIATKLLRSGFGGGGAGLERGARTSVKLALDASVEGVTGKYFVDEREAPSSRATHDLALQRRLYEVSCALGGVEPLPDA